MEVDFITEPPDLQQEVWKSSGMKHPPDSPLSVSSEVVLSSVIAGLRPEFVGDDDRKIRILSVSFHFDQQFVPQVLVMF